VAFCWDGEKSDNLDIYVKLVAETNALRLTSDPAEDVAPAWSPDGTRIAFARFLKDSDFGTVYLVSPLGGSERKLMDFPISGPLSWSPDGKWLAVSRPRASSAGSDDPAGIYLLPLEKGEPRRITSPKAPEVDDYPCFSPDGHSLAYRACSGQLTCDIYAQALDSDYVPQGELHRVTHDGLFKLDLAWTRDHKSILYVCHQSIGLYYLYRVPINGGEPPRRLELAGAHAFGPCVAAAKDRLAFGRDLTNPDIWRYQVGGKPQPFIMSSFWDLSPQISPDGRRVAFSSSRNGESTEIWTANADGSNPSQLTDKVGRGQGSPRWSADGRWIAFDSQGESGQFDIFAIDSSGGRPRQITSEPSNEHHPSWSRDGRWIYFRSDRTGQNEIWRIPADGGPAQQITTSGGNVALESTDGSTLFYSKETGGLFAKPLNGGSERKLVDDVYLGFAVTQHGIYYFGPSSEDKRPLQFYQFSSGTSRSLARIEGVWRPELTVSPDGHTFLFSASLIRGCDLMLIENFR
jgi:eukaryotic-like serine/threonine-protein kinase